MTNTATSGVDLGKLQACIEKVIQGKSDVVRQAIIALIADGHLLIEDVPGVGKTTLAHTLAKSFDCTFQRVQFTSDLLPSDIIGVTIYNQQTQQFEFRKGPIFANVVLADELNRTTPKTQSALLEVMNEGRITIDNQTYPMPRPFIVIATQNPIEHHGTYPLPESQLDRFLMRIRVGYPDAESEKRILRMRAQPGGQHLVEPVMSAADILEAQEFSKSVRVDESLVDYVMAIVTGTRKSEFLSVGVSPRGSLALFRTAQARAFVEGRDYCVPDDIKRLVMPVLAHRIIVNSKYSSPLKRSEEAEAVLTDIINNLEVPL
jgi:MoxR-like ATPase